MQRYSWEQGVAMQAFLERGEDGIVIAMAKEAVNRAVPDGRVAMMGVANAVTDPCSAGEALLHAAKVTDDPELAAACSNLLSWALTGAPRNRGGIVYHLTDKPQFWVDSMYMLPPFLAAAGRYEECLLQLSGYWAALRDADSGLLSHMWDDGEKKFARKAFWGVGNGWGMAALARVIDALPADYADERERLISMASDLIHAVLRYRRSDGLFHNVIDDRESFIETGLSQMAAYTVFRGIASGWLDKSLVSEARAMRMAVLSKVDEYGFVQGVCGAPDFDHPGVAPEGQAFFLLMERVSF